MTFAAWFEKHWKRSSETTTTALYRLHAKWGLSYKSLFYALHGARVKPETAALIEEKTGGLVRAADLVMSPTRAELRASRAEAS